MHQHMKRLNLCEGRYVKHILNLHLWFTEQKKLAYLKKKYYPRYVDKIPFFLGHSINFRWMCTHYVLLGSAFNWLYKSLFSFDLVDFVWDLNQLRILKPGILRPHMKLYPETCLKSIFVNTFSTTFTCTFFNRKYFQASINRCLM